MGMAESKSTVMLLFAYVQSIKDAISQGVTGRWFGKKAVLLKQNVKNVIGMLMLCNANAKQI